MIEQGELSVIYICQSNKRTVLDKGFKNRSCWAEDMRKRPEIVVFYEMQDSLHVSRHRGTDKDLVFQHKAEE